MFLANPAVAFIAARSTAAWEGATTSAVNLLFTFLPWLSKTNSVKVPINTKIVHERQQVTEAKDQEWRLASDKPYNISIKISK